WAHLPEKNFGVVGKSGVPLFSADPKTIDRTVMGPLKPQINSTQYQWPLTLANMEGQQEETIDGAKCTVVKVAAPESVTSLFKLPPARVEFGIRHADYSPARIRFADGKVDVEIMIDKPGFVEAWPAENWKI